MSVAVANLAEWQLAYLAGLIDGEGSIESQMETQIRGKTPRFVLRVSFVFATEEPLRTISGWLGSKYSIHPAVDARRSPRYRSHIYKATAVALLRRCLPYLILKKHQAELILAIESVRAANSTVHQLRPGRKGVAPMPDHAIQKMLSLHQKLRSLKSNKRRAA
jgi:hypothetical protein